MMTDQQQYVLITVQHDAPGGPDINAYGPAADTGKLDGAAHLIADGAEPPISWKVVPLQVPVWGSV